MISVIISSENKKIKFLSNNHDVQFNIIQLNNETSLGLIINNLINDKSKDYICIVNEDTIISSEFECNIKNLLLKLDKEWKNWGVVGNSGNLPMNIGYSATEFIKYYANPSSGPNFSKYIMPVKTINENVLLLNLSAMRKKKIIIPEISNINNFSIII
jgi:hypothetical protein